MEARVIHPSPLDLPWGECQCVLLPRAQHLKGEPCHHPHLVFPSTLPTRSFWRAHLYLRVEEWLEQIDLNLAALEISEPVPDTEMTMDVRGNPIVHYHDYA